MRSEGVTHAMVVPTMLNRILDVIDDDGDGLPSLRALSYGGGPMPLGGHRAGDGACCPTSGSSTPTG